MPTILRLDGNRFFFFSNEGDEPAHVHVESGGRHAKFWLSPVALVHAHGYNSRELRTLARVVEQHRDLFLGRWHEYFERT